MKRFLLWFFGVLIPLEFAIFFCIGKYGFYRQVKVSFPEAEHVILHTYHAGTSSEYYELEIQNYHSSYCISVSKDQGQCCKKNGYFIGYWYKMHLTLHIFYWLTIVGFFIYNLIVMIQTFSCLYTPRYEKGERFCTSCDNEVCQARCDFYNRLDDYDPTPIKNKFWRFWGY